jgi:hypothetical protein
MKNIFDTELQVCGLNPLTGYMRDGYCNTHNYDYGTHIVCAVVTKEFLDFTYMKGNDLITPRNNFPGLKPGDRWCLCVLRWIEAYNNGVAPLIDLNSTSKNVLKYVPLDTLLKYKI